MSPGPGVSGVLDGAAAGCDRCSSSATTNSCGRSTCGEWPTPGSTTSRYAPPSAAYRSRTARVWVTIGCGGQTSSPGQPGTAPRAPSCARSNTDASETIASASPRIQSTGGLTARSTIPETSNTVGAIVLSTPRPPGATPGQVALVAASPG